VKSGSIATLLALLVAATALRPQIVGAGPLFPEIQDDLGTSHAVVGLLGTIPVLCMGLFAPPGAVLARRIGTRSTMTISLALVGVFGIGRAVVPDVWLLILLTWPIGIGMGLAGAIAPIAVKERFPARPALGTGTYTMGIQIGATTSAAVVVPIAAWLGGWRWSLVVISIAACAALLLWLVLTWGEPPHRPRTERRPRLPWRSPTAWLLVVVFAVMSSGYYGVNAWLPDAYVEHGWSEKSAGALLAVFSVMAVPSSLVVPWLSDRRGGRRPYIIGMSALFALATAGLITLPSLAWGCALVAGIAQGSLFALVLTVPLDVEQRPDHVGALIGMMLGLGYMAGAVSPFLLGGVRDLTGSFDAPLWLACGFMVLIGVASLALPRGQHRPA
jgi:CP family cyanate transporter-like MFS transporter